MAIQQVVALANLGADFDIGVQTTGKLNIVAATTTAAGKVPLASAADIAAGASGKVVDAAQLRAQVSAVSGGMVYQGTWNAATNTPTLTSGSGTKGYLYKVSAAGVSISTTVTAAVASGSTSIPVASATGLVVGQQFVGGSAPSNSLITAISGTTITISQATTASIASGGTVTFNSYLDGAGPFNLGDLVAFDGLVWDKIDGPAEAVTTVAGRIGNVVLSASDISGFATAAVSAATAAATVNVQDSFGNHLYYAYP